MWRAKGWQGSAGPTWQAHARVALPLVLADAVGWAGAGVAGARHAAASLHPQGMAGLGQHGPGDAVTQSHTLQHRGESHNAPVCLTSTTPGCSHPSPLTPLRGFKAASQHLGALNAQRGSITSRRDVGSSSQACVPTSPPNRPA